MAGVARMLCSRTCSHGLSLLQAGTSSSAACTALRPALAFPIKTGQWVRGMAGQEYLQNKFPKGSFAASQTLGRPAGLRPPVVTSDQVFDPYTGVPPGMGPSQLLTSAGLRYLWGRLKSSAQNVYALAMARKHCKPFKMAAFKEAALRVYEDINTQVAAGDRRSLITSTAPNMNSMFKRQIKAREDAGWTKIEWALAERPDIKDVNVVQGRAAMGDPKDKNTGFVQFTVRLRTRQRFQAFSRDGRLVAGGPNPVEVEELWVLERPFKQQENNRWRLVGKLFPVPGTQSYSCSAPVAAHVPLEERLARVRGPAGAAGAAKRKRQHTA